VTVSAWRWIDVPDGAATAVVARSVALRTS
jgi:hypothetical protein